MIQLVWLDLRETILTRTEGCYSALLSPRQEWRGVGGMPARKKHLPSMFTFSRSYKCAHASGDDSTCFTLPTLFVWLGSPTTMFRTQRRNKYMQTWLACPIAVLMRGVPCGWDLWKLSSVIYLRSLIPWAFRSRWMQRLRTILHGISLRRSHPEDAWWVLPQLFRPFPAS